MPTVKILIVTDSYSGGYRRTLPANGAEQFHLGEFVHVLETTSWDGFNIQITKAHRDNVSGTGADLVDFDFSTHDLNQYDEIFMFPITRDGAANASPAEVAAIARFMDRGGGVFATGDHEDLGASLCRQIPRVRSMRRWYWPETGPLGEPPAPVGTVGEDHLELRHDTLREGPDDADTEYDFDDQSDNRGQEIYPRWFSSISGRYFRRNYPHPLLCSPGGVVRRLPDHAHEGQCEVPANLGHTISIPVPGPTPDYSEEEYPVGIGTTQRIAPVVVAQGKVIGGHTTNDPDKPATAETKLFGVIGAYDGHLVERAGRRLGRVAVDSTWHHFFNVNLIGDSTSPEPRKRQGFLASLLPGQTDDYEPIKAYFRNLVYWLIPHDRQILVVYEAFRTMARRPQMIEFLPKLDRKILPELRVRWHLKLAGLADHYFASVRGGCFTLQFLPIVLYPIQPLRPLWEVLQEQVYPWNAGLRVKERGEVLDPRLEVDPKIFADVVVGAAVLAAAAQEGKDDLKGWRRDVVVLATRGLREVRASLAESQKRSSAVISRLDERALLAEPSLTKA